MRILWFIVLKIVEIGGVMFALYYLGKLVHLFTGILCFHDSIKPSCAPMWLIGLIAIFACWAGVLIIIMSYLLGKLGIWELANCLTRKFKKLI